MSACLIQIPAGKFPNHTKIKLTQKYTQFGGERKSHTKSFANSSCVRTISTTFNERHLTSIPFRLFFFFKRLGECEGEWILQRSSLNSSKKTSWIAATIPDLCSVRECPLEDISSTCAKHFFFCSTTLFLIFLTFLPLYITCVCVFHFVALW